MTTQSIFIPPFSLGSIESTLRVLVVGFSIAMEGGVGPERQWKKEQNLVVVVELTGIYYRLSSLFVVFKI